MKVALIIVGALTLGGWLAIFTLLVVRENPKSALPPVPMEPKDYVVGLIVVPVLILGIIRSELYWRTHPPRKVR